MDNLVMKHSAEHRLAGERSTGIVGVVASGNCEVLLERVLPEDRVEVEVSTAVTGFDEVWQMVVADFVERWSPGGLRLSINDGGAGPDVVMLRLMQGAALMGES